MPRRGRAGGQALHAQVGVPATAPVRSSGTVSVPHWMPARFGQGARSSAACAATPERGRDGAGEGRGQPHRPPVHRRRLDRRLTGGRGRSAVPGHIADSAYHPPAMAAYRLGVDVGGTFTDLAAVGRTASSSRQGAVDAGRPVARACSRPWPRAGSTRRALEAFAHGTTVATNALLERRGAPTALIDHRGLPRRAGDRPPDPRRPLRPAARRPDPLVPRERRFTVRERCSPEGVLRAARRGQRRGRGGGRARVRRRGRRGQPALRLPPPRARGARGRGARGRAAGRPHRPLAPRAAGLPRVRAHRDDRRLGLPRAAPGRLPARPRRARRRRGPAGAAGDGVVRRPARRSTLAARNAAACVLSGPAGGVVGAAHVAALGGLRRRADARHGRHVDRRRADRRRPRRHDARERHRRRARRPADGRRAHRLGRRRLARPHRRRRRAAGRGPRAPAPGPAPRRTGSAARRPR